MNDSRLQVFDIEKRIAEDKDGAYLREVSASIRDEWTQTKSRINAGLPPDEFRAAEQYAKALETAADVLTKVWKREQK